MANNSSFGCIDLTDPYQLANLRESVCIVIEKVYANALLRECAFCSVNLPVTVGPYTFVSIRFDNGIIIPCSTIITPLLQRPNFARVQFTVQIPFNITLQDASDTLITLFGNSTDIFIDIILYYPLCRSESKVNLQIETRAQMLGPPMFSTIAVDILIGVFVVPKVTGLVQLLIPAFGYCGEPHPGLTV